MEYTEVLRKVGMKNYIPGDVKTKEGQEKMLAAVADVISDIKQYQIHTETTLWNKEIDNENEFKALMVEVACKVDELLAFANMERLQSDIAETENDRLMQAWIALDFYAYISGVDCKTNIVNVQKQISDALYARGFMIEQESDISLHNKVFDNVATNTVSLLEQEIKRLEKRKKICGIITLVCVCIFSVSLLINNFAKDTNKDRPYEEFNKKGAENVYTAVDIDFILPISESYYYNESTGKKDYTRTDYYCLFGSSKSPVHGVVKLDHSEYYDDSLKDIVEYSENPNNTTPPKSVMIYGNTEKIPAYVNQHFFEAVGVGSGYELGEVCINGSLKPTKEMSPLSTILMLIGSGSVYLFIGFLIAFLATNSNIKKKKRLLNIL